MFVGLRRVDIGEHVRYRAGALARGEHWHKYEPEANYRRLHEAVDAATAVVVDRVARYAAVANSVISDLTGGLDSRLVGSAAHAAGLEPAVTVNETPACEDITIAHQVADAITWDIRYFSAQALGGGDHP